MLDIRKKNWYTLDGPRNEFIAIASLTIAMTDNRE
jgi:hypothetical protein